MDTSNVIKCWPDVVRAGRWTYNTIINAHTGEFRDIDGEVVFETENRLIFRKHEWDEGESFSPVDISSDLPSIQRHVREINVANGWGKPDEDFGGAIHHDIVRLALIGTEVSEGIEALRHGNPPSDHLPQHPGLAEELADVIIRCLDIAEDRGYNMADVIRDKLEFNRTRGYMHGGKRA